MYKLIVAEKPSVARIYTAVLDATERKPCGGSDGFFIIGSSYIVTWCIGHLIELARVESYDEKFAKWRYADLPIIPREWKYNAAKDKAKQLKVIYDLMNRDDVECVICATDAGREGELIFRLVYNYCKCTKPIKRLWISSMEAKTVADGFQNLKDGSEYDNLYKAADCRQKADFIVGINATRLFSCLYSDTLNVGRVMTPTLALIVEREREINAFVKEPFYTVELDCGNFIVSGDKLKDTQTAEVIQSECDGKTANITAIDKREKSIMPPLLYDLTLLQREANRLHGFTSQQTLDFVQSLYEKSYVTYPRTDSRYLTEDMAEGLPELVETVIDVLSFASGIGTPVDVKRVIDNTKVTDHHAIIPTQTMTKADLSALPSGERAILYMIAVRLICAVSEKHIYNETTVVTECEKHTFTAKGKNVLKDGWKAIEQSYRTTLKDNTSEDDTVLPELSDGKRFDIVCANLREGFTSPPKHYTEDTLLSAMENASDNIADIYPKTDRKGLGTSATRAGIIEKLIKTGFVERSEGKKTKSLLPLPKGVNLITILPDTIKSPALTAEWESCLRLVEKGELSDAAFMAGIAEMTENLVKTHTAADPEYISLFESNKKTHGKPTGICPRCNKNVYENTKAFCCENKSCGFSLWKDNKFFISKRKRLTAEIAAILLSEGRVSMTGLYSERSGKTYDAVIILDSTDAKYTNFRMEFEQTAK